MPLARRDASALLTAPIGEMAADAEEDARARARAEAAALGAARLTTVSTSVFHASQEAHCPDQRGTLTPHCWQT
jgi:hypothetical protein